MSLANYVTVALEAGEMPVVPGLFYKDYEPEIDRQVACASFGNSRSMSPPSSCPTVSPKGLPKPVAWKSMSVGCSTFRTGGQCTAGGTDGSAAQGGCRRADCDPAVEFYAMFADTYRQRISPVLEEADRTLAREYRTYMRGQMEFEPERNFTRMPI